MISVHVFLKCPRKGVHESFHLSNTTGAAPCLFHSLWTSRASGTNCRPLHRIALECELRYRRPHRRRYVIGDSRRAFVACHPAKGFSLHGCGGVRPGTKDGNGVAVGAGVADAPGPGVATCARTPAKKPTKPTRTHTLTKAISDRIRVLTAGCRS